MRAFFVLIPGVLRTFLRSRKKDWVGFILNTLALGIGTCFFVIILQYIVSECRFDKFHQDYDRIYRVLSNQRNENGIRIWADTPFPLGPILSENFPPVENFTRYKKEPVYINIDQYNGRDVNLCYVDTGFFSMFSFPLLSGSFEHFRNNSNAVLISEGLARQIFGNSFSAVGKILQAKYLHQEYEVAGVVKKSELTHFDFDILQLTDYYNYAYKEVWYKDFNTAVTYIKVRDNKLISSAFQDKFIHILDNFYTDNNTKLTLQPVGRIHLYTDFNDGNPNKSNVAVLILLFAGGLIVFACSVINYQFYLLASLPTRYKEMGIRKIAGSGSRLLAYQIFQESLLTILAGILIVLLLHELIKSSLISAIWNRATTPDTMISILIACLFIALITSILPAIIISRKNTNMFLVSRDHIRSNARFRNTFLVVQNAFSLSVILLTFFIMWQYQYILKLNLGYSDDNVLAFSARGIPYQYKMLKDQLLRNPGIQAVTCTGELPGNYYYKTNNVNWEGNAGNNKITFQYQSAESSFLDVLKIKLKEGEFLPPNLDINDHFNPGAKNNTLFVLNEEAVREMGIANPVGARFDLMGEKGRIIGVVKDFKYNSLHEKTAPLVIYYNPESFNYYFVRLSGRNQKQTIQYIQNVYQDYVKDKIVFKYTFLKDTKNLLYKQEKMLSALFSIFAVVTFLILAAGIISLVSFVAQQKEKEMVIRLVFGATKKGLFGEFFRLFKQPLIISSVLSFIIGYSISFRWIENFAYHIHLSVIIFVLMITAIIGVECLFIATTYLRFIYKLNFRKYIA